MPVAFDVKVIDAGPVDAYGEFAGFDAVPIVGACGTVVGTTVFVAADEIEVPIPFLACAVNEYVVPVVNPDTLIGEEVPVNVVGEVTGDGVIINSVEGPPPPAVNETSATALPNAIFVPTSAADKFTGVSGAIPPKAAQPDTV